MGWELGPLEKNLHARSPSSPHQPLRCLYSSPPATRFRRETRSIPSVKSNPKWKLQFWQNLPPLIYQLGNRSSGRRGAAAELLATRRAVDRSAGQDLTIHSNHIALSSRTCSSYPLFDFQCDVSLIKEISQCKCSDDMKLRQQGALEPHDSRHWSL